MTRLTARQTLDAAISEKEFQQQVIDAARLHGFMVYHTFDSRRSEPGFPDLVVVHPETSRAAIWECKTERGQLTVAQARWIRAFLLAFDVDRWRVWVGVLRPSDWERIERWLKGSTP